MSCLVINRQRFVNKASSDQRWETLFIKTLAKQNAWLTPHKLPVLFTVVRAVPKTEHHSECTITWNRKQWGFKLCMRTLVFDPWKYNNHILISVKSTLNNTMSFTLGCKIPCWLIVFYTRINYLDDCCYYIKSKRYGIQKNLSLKTQFNAASECLFILRLVKCPY